MPFPSDPLQFEGNKTHEDEEDDDEYVPVAKCRALEAQRTLLRLQQRKGNLREEDEHEQLLDKSSSSSAESKPILLEKAMQLKRKQLAVITEAGQLVQQEREMMKELESDGRKTLMPVRELATGITYTEPLPTGWRPPLSVRRMSYKKRDAIRRKCHIMVDGEAKIPPSVIKFRGMRFPDPILKVLKAKGILRPTPIQMQGLAVVLSGRDMIGISFTGSGKTLVFVLPMIMMALQEECMMPIGQGEGQLGLIVCPTWELAKQTYGVIEQLLAPMRDAGYPGLRSLLCIGGIDKRSHIEAVKKGVHIVVATPGRLKDLLVTKKMSLDNCRYLTLDEAKM